MFTVFDLAGNSGSALISNVSIDKTTTTTTTTLVPVTPSGDNGWYSSNVNVSVAATDNAGGSGVTETRCVLDPGSVPLTFNDLTPGCAYTAGADVTSEGTHVVYAASKDAAGNVETVKSTSFKIDKTAPTTTINLDPVSPNGNNDWYTSAVKITVAATDAGGSGVGEIRCVLDPASPPTTFDQLPPSCGYTGAGANVAVNGMHTVYAATKDLAGNKESSVESTSFKIDTTAPTTTTTLVPATPSGDNGWYSSNVHVSVAATDNAGGSGVAETRCVLDPASVPSSFNDIASGCALIGAGTDVTTEGTHVVYAASKDAAGNVETVKSTSFKIDKTGPTTTITLAPAVPNGNNGWYTSAVNITVAAIDNAGGSGVGEIRCVLDPSVPPATFNDIPAGCAYTAGANVTANGTHVVYAASKDIAGNVETAIKSTSLKIDDTAPTTTTTLVPVTPDGANGWYKSDVHVSVAATDPAGGSGVAETRCILDPVSVPSSFNAVPAGCAYSGAGTNVTTDGTHVVYAASKDAAGNVEAVRSTAFKIDKTNPVVAISSPSSGFSTIASTIAVSGTVSDATSGIAALTLNNAPVTNYGSGTWTVANLPLVCGPNTFTARATDNAGNYATATITATRLCFTFEYLQPLDQSYIGGSVRLNQGKYGRVIPVKGNVKLGGVAQDQATLQGYGLTVVIGVNPVLCEGGSATEAVEQYADAGQSNGGTNAFRWSLDGFWIYNLDTKAPPNMKMDIGKCYRLDAYVQETASPVNKVKVSESPYAIFNPVK
jgi:hypothetical protein